MAAGVKARVVVSADNMVRVKVPAEAMYHLETIQQVQKSVLGRLGCPTCCSGRFILYEQEEGEFGVG
ncbi:MAG TPA: hypothetical protein VF007_02600 [Stellaceae bacterium]